MRALVVEDNARIADFVGQGLGQAGFAVDKAPSLEAASDLLAVGQFDLVLLDLGFPDGDGLTWLRRIRMGGNRVPVLILTARDGIGDRVTGLDSGADDYLVKPFEMDELMARCRALMRRPAEALDSRLSVGNVVLDLACRSAQVADISVELGRRETDILESLMRRAGKIVTRETLESQVYSLNEEFTPNAIEAAMSRLRRKLAEAGSNIDIQTVRGVGYLINSP